MGKRTSAGQEAQITMRSHDGTTGSNGVVAPGHRMLLYEQDGTLLENVLDHYRRTLAKGGTAVAIVRRSHLDPIVEHFDHSTRVPEVNFVAYDANDVLARFMRRGRPDAALFDASVGQIIRDAIRTGPPVAAFGEMAAILWERGEEDASVELEKLWNELGTKNHFELMCAYSTRGVLDPAVQGKLLSVCGQHADIAAPSGFRAMTTTA